MVRRAGIVRLRGLGQDLAPGILQPGYASVAVDPQTGTVVETPGASYSQTSSTVYYQQGTADTGNPMSTAPGSGSGGGGAAAGAGTGAGGSIFGSPGGSPGGLPFGTCDPNSGWGKIFGCTTGGSGLLTMLLIGGGLLLVLLVGGRR